MTELYSVRDVARLFALQESRLRYWMQTGFVGPTVRKGGRFYYTFRDLCAVKAAKDLLAAGLSAQKVRKNLEALRRALPGDAHPALRLTTVVGAVPTHATLANPGADRGRLVRCGGSAWLGVHLTQPTPRIVAVPTECLTAR